MNKIILFLLLSLTISASFAVESAAERKATSLSKNIDLMTKDAEVYKKQLATAQRIKANCHTEPDIRKVDNRITEINRIIASLQKRIEKATAELQTLKPK